MIRQSGWSVQRCLRLSILALPVIVVVAGVVVLLLVFRAEAGECGHAAPLAVESSM